MSADGDVPEIVRRIAAAQERRGRTYLGQTQDLDDMGGRFARVVRTTVTGTEPITRYPNQPVDSPWHADPIGTEPPLGVSVDAIEPVGELHERFQDVSSSGPVEPATPSQRIRLRRRI